MIQNDKNFESLKKTLESVQSEIARCVAILGIQSERVSDALEILTTKANITKTIEENTLRDSKSIVKPNKCGALLTSRPSLSKKCTVNASVKKSRDWSPVDSSARMTSQSPSTSSPTTSRSTEAKSRVSDKIFLSDSQAGSLIGKSGLNKLKLERTFNVSISVGGYPGERDRLVEIRGNRDQVSKAVETINKMSADDRSRMMSLKVSGLSYRTCAEDLEGLFDKYGRIWDVFIPKDHRTKESRGFGFVRFYNKNDAEAVIDALDGRKYDGRKLSIQFARGRRRHSSDRSDGSRD